ncbi:MAG: RNA polymerase sigma factor, partial [Gammaproteobacteria bacterium]|nr:RNA polymerase sigma factor [Gammaproteobacteria bacterium]
HQRMYTAPTDVHGTNGCMRPSPCNLFLQLKSLYPLTVDRGLNAADVFSDNELMLRVRDGDNARLGMLFERHHKKLYNFFLHTVGKRQVAEDLTQEVFVRMLKYKHTYRGDSGFGPWMFRLARNVSSDHFRRAGNAPFDSTSVEILEPTDEKPLPPELLETNQSIEILRKAMARLPIEKRELLIMARFELLKQGEIASTLDCSVGTVKVRIHRAIKELTQIYHQMTCEVRA